MSELEKKLDAAEKRRRMPKPTLADIAARIDAHLKRMADVVPGIGPNAEAWTNRRCVFVIYVLWNGQHNLSRAEAERYLAWLDAGNVGKHWDALDAQVVAY